MEPFTPESIAKQLREIAERPGISWDYFERVAKFAIEEAINHARTK